MGANDFAHSVFVAMDRICKSDRRLFGTMPVQQAAPVPCIRRLHLDFDGRSSSLVDNESQGSRVLDYWTSRIRGRIPAH